MILQTRTFEDATGPGRGDRKGADRRPPSNTQSSERSGRFISPLVLVRSRAAIGRFVPADSEAGQDDPIPALDQSLANGIARLEHQAAQHPDHLRARQQLGALYTRRAGQGGDPAVPEDLRQ